MVSEEEREREVEVEVEIDGIMEKTWELHDKLSDAIHSVSRAHYLRTTTKYKKNKNNKKKGDEEDELGEGYVFAKVYPTQQEEEEEPTMITEAKSLNAIRTALENLEDHLHFFQTVQVQQRAERDAAIARLEQSRIFLAQRLSEHHGKKYKVIEEALAFVDETNQFVSTNYPGEKSVTYDGISSNIFKVVVKSFDFAKKSFNIKEMGGVLGNAALVALSMLALLHLHQMSTEDKYILGPPLKQESALYNKVARRSHWSDEPSSSDHLAHLDVTLARG